MPWWLCLLIAMTSYVTGFLVSGAVYAHLMAPSTDKEDMTGAMMFWPVIFPCYLVYHLTCRYVNFLERVRRKRIRY